MPSARDVMFASGGVGLVVQAEQPGWFSGGGPAPKEVGLQGTARSTATDRKQNLPRSEVLKRSALAASDPDGGYPVAGRGSRMVEERTEDELRAEATDLLVSNCGPEFHISVDRTDGCSLGIEVEHYTDSVLIIMKIGEGLIQDWNTANPDQILEENDLIVGANDVLGDVEQILLECRKTAPLSIAIRRPACKSSAPKKRDTEFTVTLDKTQGARLGLDVNHDEGRELFIEKIDEGLVLDWNKEHPDRQVLIDDRIVEVNGVSGDVKLMLNECMQDALLELTLIRSEME